MTSINEEVIVPFEWPALATNGLRHVAGLLRRDAKLCRTTMLPDLILRIEQHAAVAAALATALDKAAQAFEDLDDEAFALQIGIAEFLLLGSPFTDPEDQT